VVNVVGFICIGRLTTNVTGHFAFLVNDFLNFDFVDALVLFLFVFAFFLGSFVASTIIEVTSKQSDRNVFVAPIALEVLILLFLGFEGAWLMATAPNIIALLLLFAMGLQNSLVTKISNAVVRTTHLTGLLPIWELRFRSCSFIKKLPKGPSWYPTSSCGFISSPSFLWGASAGA